MNYLSHLQDLGIEKLQVSGSKDFVSGCCPFHEDFSPSFSVNLKTGQWKCWSGCGSGSFLQLMADLKGTAPERSNVVFLKAKKQEGPFKLNPIDDTTMTKTFQERGFTFSMLKPFGIGFDLVQKMMCIPVQDPKGNVVGAIWRQKPGNEPRYLNSTGLQRSQLVYGLHLVPTLVSEVWICEGPLNAVWLTAAGKSAVAFFGSKFNYEQIDILLTKSPQRVIVAFDNDEAGRVATQKLIKLLLKKKVNTGVAVLPAGVNDVQQIPVNEIGNLNIQGPLQVLSTKGVTQ